MARMSGSLIGVRIKVVSCQVGCLLRMKVVDGVNDFLCFAFHAVGVYYLAAQGYAIRAGVEDIGYVGDCYATDSYDGCVYVVAAALPYYLAVAVEAEGWGEVLLGRGEAEGAAADIVDVVVYGEDVLESVAGAAYDEFVAEYLAGLRQGHIVLAEVYARGVDALADIDVVVDYECGVGLVGQFFYGAGGIFDNIFGCVFHTQLNP